MLVNEMNIETDEHDILNNYKKTRGRMSTNLFIILCLISILKKHPFKGQRFFT